MQITSAGLTLRTPVDADAPIVTASVIASLRELSQWMPWATSAYLAEDALRWINGELGDAHRFVMVDATGAHVGNCGLNRIDEANHGANLGYWVRSDRAGRGYATTATRLLAAYGLADAGLHRLEVIMSVRNGASRRVAEKAGARYEGIARGRLLLHGEYHDTHVWSFVAGDP